MLISWFMKLLRRNKSDAQWMNEWMNEGQLQQLTSYPFFLRIFYTAKLYLTSPFITKGELWIVLNHRWSLVFFFPQCPSLRWIIMLFRLSYCTFEMHGLHTRCCKNGAHVTAHFRDLWITFFLNISTISIFGSSHE